jgi:hypothetical protein
MAETKPFASLSSGLLARKGAAKPAMRPQGFGSFVPHGEDLGWNDMGEAPEHVPSSIEALTPIGGRAHAEPAPEDFEPPVVLHQQRAIEESFTPEPEREPETVAPEAEIVKLAPRRPVRAARPVAATIPARAKAAFTLRLDPDRHLKLRLACAVTRRSAQQLVTSALDDFLDTLPEVEAMADRLPAESGRRSR